MLTNLDQKADGVWRPEQDGVDFILVKRSMTKGRRVSRSTFNLGGKPARFANEGDATFRAMQLNGPRR